MDRARRAIFGKNADEKKAQIDSGLAVIKAAACDTSKIDSYKLRTKKELSDAEAALKEAVSADVASNIFFQAVIATATFENHLKERQREKGEIFAIALDYVRVAQMKALAEAINVMSKEDGKGEDPQALARISDFEICTSVLREKFLAALGKVRSSIGDRRFKTSSLPYSWNGQKEKDASVLVARALAELKKAVPIKNTVLAVTTDAEEGAKDLIGYTTARSMTCYFRVSLSCRHEIFL